MPWGLNRLHKSGQSHFITFCCYHRLPLLVDTSSKRTFELALERVRRKFGLCVYGYVIMPEHVHLLLNEPARETLAEAIKSLKQGVARRRIGGGWWTAYLQGLASAPGRVFLWDLDPGAYHQRSSEVPSIPINSVPLCLCVESLARLVLTFPFRESATQKNPLPITYFLDLTFRPPNMDTEPNVVSGRPPTSRRLCVLSQLKTHPDAHLGRRLF